MRSSRFGCGVVVALFGLGCVASGALAQPGVGRDVVTARAAPVEPLLVDVDFAGGTLEEFAEALRKAAGTRPVNFVIREGAGEIEVPRVLLRSVTPEAAFQAVCPRPLASVNIVQAGGDPIIIVEGRQTSVGQGGRPSSEFVALSGARSSVVEEPRLRIYSVKELLSEGGLRLEAIMDALKLALSVQDKGGSPDLLYHEQSGVLIVRGTVEQQEAVEAVLRTLVNDTTGGRLRQEQRAQAARAQVSRLRAIQAQAEKAMVELEARQTMLAQLEVQAREGVANERELAASALEARKAEISVRQLRAELDAGHAELAAMGDLGGGWAQGGDEAEQARAERSVTISKARMGVVLKLFEVMGRMRGDGVGPRIEVIEVREDGCTLEYVGNRSGVEDFDALCQLIESLGGAE